MSGGVDSSVAAALAQKAGFACTGVTMKLHPSGSDVYGEKCGSPKDAQDAAKIAQRLGMDFYSLDFSEEFADKVVCPFVECYERGNTPNPCIECNRYMKFGHLYDEAKKLDCDKVVTGHYARVEFDGERYLLKRAKNLKKDQSYVLYFLSQEQLAHTYFPLGEMESKEQVRALAAEFGFENASRPDSQDICFVPDGDYAAFIHRYTGKKYPAGNFVDPEGKVLGRHKGLISYTIGQRRGLGLALPQPGYVVEKRVKQNEVVVGTREGLLTEQCRIGGLNWIAFDAPADGMRVEAVTRYQAPAAPAHISPCADGTLILHFDTPQKRPAAGQSTVFYDGDTVLGGGIVLD